MSVSDAQTVLPLASMLYTPAPQRLSGFRAHGKVLAILQSYAGRMHHVILDCSIHHNGLASCKVHILRLPESR